MTKIAGSGSISQRHGSAESDPYQTVMDPHHCIHVIASHCVQEYFLEDCIQMTNFVPGPTLALRGRDKKNNKKSNNEEEDDEGMDDDEGKFYSMNYPAWGIRDILVRIRTYFFQ
jgi:hypothetical protein